MKTRAPKSLKKREISSIALASLLLAPSFALAQSTADKATEKSRTVLPTVTVTGTVPKSDPNADVGYNPSVTRVGKTTQDKRNIPQGITTVTRQLVLDQGGDDFKDALRNVAGLTFNAGEGGRIGDNINLRGFSSVGDIYLDGMRDTAQYNRETFNTERTEVLRGSASMLFGRGSTGGVINQVSKEPFLLDKTVVSTTLGDYDYRRLNLDFNQAVGENAALRLNALTHNEGNQREGVDSKRVGFAPSLRWGIGTTDEFQLSYYHLNYDDTPELGVAWVGERPVDEAAHTFYGLRNVNYQRDSANATTASWIHRFSPAAEVRTVYRHGDYKRDMWANTVRFPSGTTSINANTTVNRGNQTRGGEEQHDFIQSDLTGKFEAFGLKHEALFGTEIALEKSHRWSYTGTATAPSTTFGNPNIDSYLPDDRSRSNPNSFESSSLGIYAQDMLQITPHWKVLGGLRWDNFGGEYTRSAGGDLSRRDRVWSYRGGVIYQPTTTSSYYASVGTSFNSSGDLYQYDDRGSNTDPEKNRNYELGAKWELADGDLSLRTSLFRSEKYNERNTDTEQSADAYVLSGKRHTDGIEVEAAGRITPNWEMFGALAYMWANIDEAAGNNASTKGLTPGNTPRLSGSLWSTYRLTPRWKIGGGAEGASKRTPPDNYVNTAPGYVRWDAMVSYDLKPINVQLNLINLFDTVYWQSLYRGHAIAGTGRAVRLSMAYTF